MEDRHKMGCKQDNHPWFYKFLRDIIWPAWPIWLLITVLFTWGVSANAGHKQKLCRSKIYTIGPIRGEKGGCYCVNPKNGKKKYIKRKYCTKPIK